ncbi:MAG: hypothetical protein M1386_00030 [Candidatus Thermoplasmatota archaeon]|nr:hypothetical protein [Candidatus Thermoplasmatota archaeon]
MSLPDGTYNYSIVVDNASFKPVYSTGAFLLSGHPVDISVLFKEVVYPVIFNEKGLPSGVVWSVSVDGSNKSATTGSNGTGDYVIFGLMNGSYRWEVPSTGVYAPFPQNGSFVVNGRFVLIDLQFEQAYSQVIFADVGLPVNSSWSVTMNGVMKHSNVSEIAFVVPFGQYNYSASTTQEGFHSFTGQRVVLANKFNVFVDVYFWSRNYSVVFNESGLPSGSEWSLELTGKNYNSTNSSIIVHLPNGTYYYAVYTKLQGYLPVKGIGTFVVNGSEVNVSVIFKPLAYSVVFNRSGPSFLRWEVQMDGSTVATNSSVISFNVAYGDYYFFISVFNKDYSVSPFNGTVYVTGNMSISVVFTPVTFKQIFIETGLKENFTWSVTIGNVTATSSNASVVLNETNGTYSFKVSANNYTAFPSSGNITVAGESRAVDVKFVSFVYVSFSVFGIPSGSSWSLIIDGKQFNSSSSILSAYVPNGTYYYIPGGTGNFSYSVILPQGYSLSSEGSFNATSSAVISLVAQPTGGVTGMVIPIWEYLVVVAVAVGIVLIVGVLFLIKRRGK